MTLDQFYTCPEVAEHCWSVLRRKAACLVDWEAARFLEPSAGAGAFLHFMPIDRRQGMDLAPKTWEVRYGDFLEARSEVFRLRRPWVVAGNPPFGFAAGQAVRFFNKAAEFADVIAFIVPRSFRKPSVQDRLSRLFWLKHDEDVADFAFLLEGDPHDVPCAWQIWQRHPRFKQRPLSGRVDVGDWIRYVKHQMYADFCVRRVGGRAGQVLPGGEEYSPSSTYFIRDLCGWAQDVLEEADFSRVRENTAGVRSVSKQEIGEALVKGAPT